MVPKTIKLGRFSIPVVRSGCPPRSGDDYDSYLSSRCLDAGADRCGEPRPYPLAFQMVISAWVELVDDAEIKKAVVTLLEHTHNLAEGAGAAPLAAALQLKGRLAGKKVALVMSGGNLSVEKLRDILQK